MTDSIEMCCDGLCDVDKCLCDPRFCDASDEYDGWSEQ